MKPEGFRNGDVVLLKQEDKGIAQTLWTNPKTEIPVFRINQRWDNEEEITIYLYLYEIEQLARAARDYVFPPGDGIQEWEDYLDAQERHDEST